ncbi:alpha-2-macroglobulin family protein [Castellaniella sp. GW247-6E4]|uniref:alpha-2-macroglobulin family protein n=1 Tax=Castellaniella sp. GW247-6E4 TaxID=3140380 RepID=UPI003314A1B1
MGRVVERVLAGALVLVAASAAGAAEVARFTPQGVAARVSQVQADFPAPAVALGDDRAVDPFVIRCDAGAPLGVGRWVDASHWVFTFRKPLAGAVSCSASVNPDFRDLEGRPLAQSTSYAFSTGGPRPTMRRPWGSTIDEDQVFVLSFNALVDAATVSAHTVCRVQGIGEAVAVRLIEGAARREILESAGMEDAVPDAGTQLVQCKRTLPAKAKVRLEVGPGVRTLAVAGAPAVPSTRAHGFDFRVREAFAASMRCMREHAQAACSPLGDIVLGFSAPVPTERAMAATLETAQGVRRPASVGVEAPDFVDQLRFEAPFPENEALRLTLPEDIRDDAGRPLSNRARFPLPIPTAALPPLVKFASGTFGVVERFAEAPAASGEAAAVVPLALRRVEPELLSRELTISAGTARDHVTTDDAEALRWYAKVAFFDGGALTARQIEDARALRTLGEEGPDVPRIDLRKVSLFGERDAARTLRLPGVSQDPAIEVVGVPLAEPGFHVIEVESAQLGASLLGESAPVYVRTSVLVTNLAVHVKTGRDDLLVWVTSLDDGRPVGDAQVAVLDCAGRRLDQGSTDARGLWHRMGAIENAAECYGGAASGLFVTARVAADHPEAGGQADFSFAWTSWNRGIESWRFPVSTESSSTPDLVAHAVIDRTLLHPGDPVSMKVFARVLTRTGMDNPPTSRLPPQAVIEHEGSGERAAVDLDWMLSPSGGRYALLRYDVQPTAKLGRYAVTLEEPRPADAKGWEWAPSHRIGEFRVESFQLPVLTGSLKLSTPQGPGPLVAPESVRADVQLAYVSGGPAAGQAVSLSAVSRPLGVGFPGYEDYAFGVPDGMRSDEDRGQVEGLRRLILDKYALQLDSQGGAQVQLPELPRPLEPQSWLVEASFTDPNGEVQTIAQAAPVWPSAVVVGLRTGGSLAQGEAAEVGIVALDPSGRPVVGVEVRLDGRVRTVYSTRKRLVGGFYRYDSYDKVAELGTLCQGKTDERGLLACPVRMDRWGEIQLFARAADAQGRVSQAASSVWVWGGDAWFGGGEDDRIDVIPERKVWKPGETAEFQVRMPFRRAQALVAVEREGVLETHVLELDGDQPVIRLPVKAEWGPNVYVSVLAVRGRVREVPWSSFFSWGWREPLDWYRAWSNRVDEAPVPTGLVDLAKPSFRFGLAEIQVDDGQSRLQVSVQADRPQYQVRETAQVDVEVRRPDGAPAAGASLAFAAVDEALLELMGNPSWDVSSAMRVLRGYGVETATGMGEVVGRRHYGRKAVPAGGGGGFSPTRELFDTLLLWRGEVVLDAQGRARIEVPLNDALTRFRLVAVADSGPGLFGMGQTDITVTQDLQLIAGLPRLVRGGDTYTARVTVRNRTDRAMAVRAEARVAAASGAARELQARALNVAPGMADVIEWPVTAPEASDESGFEALEWDIRATGTPEGGGKAAADHIRVAQRLAPAVPVRARQASLVPLRPGEPLRILVDATPAALKNAAGQVRGAVQVGLRSSLAGVMPGVRAWLSDYPYTCLEQLSAKALGLRDPAAWEALMRRLPGYLDERGLAAYFPGGRGSVVLTAHLLSVAAEASALGWAYTIPEESRPRMVTALQDFVLGRIESDDWAPARDEAWRKVIAIEALARNGAYRPGMLDSIDLDVTDWPSAALVDWLSILRNVPGIEQRAQRLTEAKALLRGRLTRHGTTLVLDDDTADSGWWLMSSAAGVQARLLMALLTEADWREDMPRLAMGLMSMQRRGAWLTTTANVLGSLAMAHFARAFESTAGEGEILVGLDGGAPARTLSWQAMPERDGVHAQTIDLPWTGVGRDVLTLEPKGAGGGWAAISARTAVADAQPVDAGMRIERRIEAVARARPDHWSPGDVYRVHLRIEARMAAVWAVVSDPVPAGASILGSGLGRDSAIATRGEQAVDGGIGPSFIERDAGMYRAYFEVLPSGVRNIEYTVRIDAPGHFQLPPTRIEALYQPDVFGSAPNAPFDVEAP